MTVASATFACYRTCPQRARKRCAHAIANPGLDSRYQARPASAGCLFPRQARPAIACACLLPRASSQRIHVPSPSGLDIAIAHLNLQPSQPLRPESPNLRRASSLEIWIRACQPLSCRACVVFWEGCCEGGSLRLHPHSCNAHASSRAAGVMFTPRCLPTIYTYLYASTV